MGYLGWIIRSSEIFLRSYRFFEFCDRFFFLLRGVCSIPKQFLVLFPIPTLKFNSKSPEKLPSGPNRKPDRRCQASFLRGQLLNLQECITYPIGSMYGIFTYIYHNQPNVGKYTIHGSLGYYFMLWLLAVERWKTLGENSQVLWSRPGRLTKGGKVWRKVATMAGI